MRVRIKDQIFEVDVADTEQQRLVGLSTLDTLPKGKGLIMKFAMLTDTPIRMSDMKFPLDLIFINGNKVVEKITAQNGIPDVIPKKKYDSVLEINAGEGSVIRVGSVVDYVGSKNEDGTVDIAEGGIETVGSRHLLDEDGKNQMNLIGAERVFSRKDVIKFYKYATEKQFKKLGRLVVDSINRQDTKDPEYSNN